MIDEHRNIMVGDFTTTTFCFYRIINEHERGKNMFLFAFYVFDLLKCKKTVLLLKRRKIHFQNYHEYYPQL